MLRHSVSLANTTTASLEERLTGMSLSQSMHRVIDSRAALDSFRTHWLQVLDIMRRKVLPPGSDVSSSSAAAADAAAVITADDVTSILNHIDQMVTLLLQESNGMTGGSADARRRPSRPPGQPSDSSPDQASNAPSSAEFMVSPLLGELLPLPSTIASPHLKWLTTACAH